MALSQRLELRASQSLVMTPQLQQAIKLLQLNNLELVAYVEQELEHNPLLERDERDRTDPAADAAGSRRGDEDDHDDRSGEQDWQAAPDAFSDDLGPEFSAGAGSAGGASGDEELSGIDQRASQEIGLRQHLLDQVQLIFPEGPDRAIAQALVDCLDEAGYLAYPLEELAELLGAQPARIEAVLTRLHGCDPAGVFARNLAECLAIQLRERDRLDPAMRTLLDNLDLAGNRDWARLRRLCGVDSEDLSDMLGELRALDPRPAMAFEGPPVQPLVPDILMRPGRAGGWHLELNPDTLPKVLVNQRYVREISGAASRARDKEARSYLSERLQSANWLVRALEQRANTILKVAGAVVEHQRAFFDHGVEHLRPLTLREIAERIEMHESTVSRVTANKYMATPRGTFELKYFFTATIQGADGGSHSAEAVRHRIKTLIDEETPDSVLSDDRIVAILRSEGIDIARRTVAKYRDALRIPSSTQRKREKAAIA
jgi:RNA polymerase sigma-54 factor